MGVGNAKILAKIIFNFALKLNLSGINIISARLKFSCMAIRFESQLDFLSCFKLSAPQVIRSPQISLLHDDVDNDAR